MVTGSSEVVILAKDGQSLQFDFGRFPRGIEMMQGGQAFPDVGAGAHLLSGTNQDSHGTVADLVEEHLFFGVRFGMLNGYEGIRPADSDNGNALAEDRLLRLTPPPTLNADQCCRCS